LVATSESSAQQKPPAITEPKLLSVFPSAGRQGTTVQAEIRGNLIQGSYAVWFDGATLAGRVLKVEEASEQPAESANGREEKPAKSSSIYRALTEVTIPPSARFGVHLLRLICPNGVSDPMRFRVVGDPLVMEIKQAHQSVKQAQPIDSPVIVNGQLKEPGETDYYSFQTKAGEELSFDVLQNQNCDVRFALYRGGASWLDPDRFTHVLFHEDQSNLIRPQARRTYRVAQAGQYFLEVSSLFGRGGPGSSYQIRIDSRVPAPQYHAESDQTQRRWIERNFSRELAGNWINALQLRAVKKEPESAAPKNAAPSEKGTPAGAATKPPMKKDQPSGHGVAAPASVNTDREPSDRGAQAQNISIPALIEGSIEKPGDLDSFKFKVDSGQGLAFEIQTLDAKPPYFNPRLGIVDSQNHELFSNVERTQSRFNANGDPEVYLKDIEPKAVYTFERGGEYTLDVRDITSRYGNPAFRYRILVRPEIPHVGEISVVAGRAGDLKKRERINRINLVRGKPKKLMVIASYEEGFSGDLSFAFTGLPDGVQAFPAIQYEEEEKPLETTENPEIIAPKREKATIVVLASPEARLTSEPVMVQLYCRPMVNGTLGPNLPVQEVPLMVVEGSPQKEGEKPQAGR